MTKDISSISLYTRSMCICIRICVVLKEDSEYVFISFLGAIIFRDFKQREQAY